MNKLILCEGKSDVVLLSYYLDKKCGWSVSRKPPKNIDIKIESKRNECGYWYKKNSDYLFICGVGGKDNFGRFFYQNILRTILDSSSFSKIAVITDRDDRIVEDIVLDVVSWMRPIKTALQENIWSVGTYEDSFGTVQEVQILLRVIPSDHEGAMETVLLEAISEDPYDTVIVEKSGEFVASMESVADRYLCSRRLKLKAHLAVTWAIQSPEKEFHFIDEQIRERKWEDSEILYDCFSQLIEI